MFQKILIILCFILTFNNTYAMSINSTISAINNFFQDFTSNKLKKFTIIDITGNIYNNQSIKNKYLVVNFWASWCTPCLKEIPHLVKFYNKYQHKVEILGLNYEQTDENIINDFIDKFMINYPIVAFKGTNVAEFNTFGKVTVMPTTFIYNPDGKLIKTHKGIINADDLKNYTINELNL